MRTLRFPTAVLIVGALAVSMSLGAGSALAKGTSEHCVAQIVELDVELDLNEYFGLTDRITAPFCTKMRIGEHWRPEAAWFMNTTFEQVPAGFTPAGATPLDDFRAKFLGVRIVVDSGTRHERSYEFTNTDQLFVNPHDPISGLPLVSTVTLTRLHPLSEGRYAYDVYWRFSDMHCDGLGPDPSANCLQAGENLLGYWGATIDVFAQKGDS